MNFDVSFSSTEITAIKAAQEGNTEELFDLAVKFATDDECQDYRKSLAMFEICAENGVLTAHKNLVLFYLKGWGTEQNLEKALEHQRVCVLEDYTGLPQYVAIAKARYGPDETFVLLVEVIQELEENKWYPENSDEPYRMFAELLYSIGQETTDKQAEGLQKSMVWFEKSANLGNINSAQLAMLARGVRASSTKALKFHDLTIEDSKWVMHWAKMVMDSDECSDADKQAAYKKYQESALDIAMALYFSKDYQAALDALMIPALNGIPMAQLVAGCACYMIMEDYATAHKSAQYLKPINNLENWRNTDWDFYTNYFMGIGGLALASFYRMGVVDGCADLEAAYKTLQNVVNLIPEDCDFRENVFAELRKYTRSWLGKLNYSEG